MDKKLEEKIENEMKEVLGGYHIDKDKIKDAFDEHLKLLNQPIRPVRFFDDYKSCYDYLITKTKVSDSAAHSAAYNVAYNAADSAAYNAAHSAAHSAAYNVAYRAADSAAYNAAHSAAYNAAYRAAYRAADSAAYSAACQCKKNTCPICQYVKILNPFLTACKNGLFRYWIMDDEIVAMIKPQIRHLNGILHSEFQPAVEWKDEKYWFLNGVKFKRDLWQKIVDKMMKFDEIIKIQDVDKRTIAYKYCDIKELLKGAKAELICPMTERGNELYKVPKGEIFNEDEYCLYYFCPSSGREYLKWVEPQKAKEVNYNADSLQADSHKFTLDEYLNKYFIST